MNVKEQIQQIKAGVTFKYEFDKSTQKVFGLTVAEIMADLSKEAQCQSLLNCSSKFTRQRITALLGYYVKLLSQ